MLGKLILGGVTLGAMGYGLKVYCDEEGCGFFGDDDVSVGEDDKTPISENDSASNYYYYKVSLYKSSISEFNSLVNQLENCPIAIVKPNSIEFELEETTDGSSDVDKIAKRMRRYGKLLLTADELLSSELYALRNIIEVNPDYKTLTEIEQVTVQRAYQLANVMALLCHEKIVDEDGSITKHSKELLKSQRVIVNSITVPKQDDHE